MERVQRSNKFKLILGVVALTSLSLLAIGSMSWVRLPGCNECHGGGGGGGFCPALSQGVWFWGNTDDVLFRLVTLGSADLEKQGFTRIQYGTVHAGMPMMGHTIKTADHLWKSIAVIRSINPPGTIPPEKVIPGRMHAVGEAPPG